MPTILRHSATLVGQFIINLGVSAPALADCHCTHKHWNVVDSEQNKIYAQRELPVENSAHECKETKTDVQKHPDRILDNDQLGAEKHDIDSGELRCCLLWQRAERRASKPAGPVFSAGGFENGDVRVGAPHRIPPCRGLQSV